MPRTHSMANCQFLRFLATPLQCTYYLALISAQFDHIRLRYLSIRVRKLSSVMKLTLWFFSFPFFNLQKQFRPILIRKGIIIIKPPAVRFLTKKIEILLYESNLDTHDLLDTVHSCTSLHSHMEI